MSISRNRHPIAAKMRGTRGMSLVELLVAMVIFVVLLAGLSVLFTGAISATRAGYQNQEAFERVRGSLSVMDRDLSGAFTAREYGDYYQFFGAPQGFCFVGVVDGKLARVSYAVHPTAEALRFTASHTETYDNLHTRLRQQTLAYNDATLFPRFLSLIGDQLPFPPDPNLDFLDSNFTAEEQVLRETVVDFPQVWVETQSLVRYVEPGIGDLETFQIRRRNGTVLQWPELDFDAPTNAAYNPSGNNPGSINDYYDRSDPDSVRLYAYLLDAFNPYVLPNDAIPAGYEDLLGVVDAADPNEDMRFIYSYSAVQAFNRDALEAIYQAKRREVWVRMLAGDPGLPQFWGNSGDPGDLRPKAEDYVVTDALLAKMYLEPMPDFDLMGAPQMFFYRPALSVNSPVHARSFNSVDRVSGYKFAYTAGYSAFAEDPIAGFQTIDTYFAANLNSTEINDAMFGSPLFPRLPGIVSPGFWLIIPSKWVDSKDFLRWFTQDISVPAAAGRNVNSVLTRRDWS